MTPKADAHVVTFYSFKGGVGRTMALANTGAQLAARGFRVLMIDFDLEAPGLSYLQHQDTPGLVDLLLDARERGLDADLFALPAAEVVARHARTLELPPQMRGRGGELRLMPAGRLAGDYSANLERLALAQLYKDGDGQPLMAAFKAILREADAFDFVLVDSRTGFSEESGICTRDLADAVVVVMGLNRQNREGTAAFLAALRAAGQRPLTVVMSPVPNGEEEAVERAEVDAAASLTAAWGAPVRVAVRIPYHPALALTEELRFWPKGWLSDAYGRLFDEVCGLLQLTADSLVAQVMAAAHAKDLPRAIRAVQTLGRIKPEALERVVWVDEVLALLKRDDGDALHDVLLELLPDSKLVAHHVAFALSAARIAAAGRWFERALTASVLRSAVLGDYANFLTDVRHDHDAAEGLYRRAIEADPRDSAHLGNYALFLTDVRHDHDAAEGLYRRALEADPRNSIHLGNYATFLTHIRRDHDAAEGLYRRSIEADPRDSDYLGNYAQLLLHRRRTAEALPLLERAWAADPPEAVQCELLFYAWAHQLAQPPDALERLLTLLRAGARSVGWHLDDTIRVAVEDGHPAPELLVAVAKVLTGAAEASSLDGFAAWRAGDPR